MKLMVIDETWRYLADPPAGGRAARRRSVCAQRFGAGASSAKLCEFCTYKDRDPFSFLPCSQFTFHVLAIDKIQPDAVALLRSVHGGQLRINPLLLGFVSGDQVLALVFQNEDAPVLQ